MMSHGSDGVSGRGLGPLGGLGADRNDFDPSNGRGVHPAAHLALSPIAPYLDRNAANLCCVPLFAIEINPPMLIKDHWSGSSSVTGSPRPQRHRETRHISLKCFAAMPLTRGTGGEVGRNREI